MIKKSWLWVFWLNFINCVFCALQKSSTFCILERADPNNVNWNIRDISFQSPTLHHQNVLTWYNNFLFYNYNNHSGSFFLSFCQIKKFIWLSSPHQKKSITYQKTPQGFCVIFFVQKKNSGSKFTHDLLLPDLYAQ